jgi:hypothetical protein
LEDRGERSEGSCFPNRNLLISLPPVAVARIQRGGCRTASGMPFLNRPPLGALAAYAPGRRATRVNSVVALRCE